MKLLWLRFRRWLIRKLGGVLPGDIIPMTKVVERKVEPKSLIRYKEQLDVNLDYLHEYSDPYYAVQAIKSRILHKLVSKIVEDRRVQLYRTDHPESQSITYEIRLAVLIPEEDL